MSGAGAGAGGFANASSVAQAAARVAAAAAANAIGSSMAEVQAAVQDMIDQGLIQNEAEDLAYCPKGHAFDRALENCPKCGAEPDDPPSSDELLAADDEILRDEDRSVSDQEDDTYLEEAYEPGFLEQLEVALIESGCPQPLELALELAEMCGGELPVDDSVLKQLEEAHGWGKQELARIEHALLSLCRAENQVPAQDAGSTQSSADIRIWREGQDLRWDVIDNLQGLVQTCRSGSVVLGGTRFTHERVRKLLSERRDRLFALAKALINNRKAFFDEPDPAKAAKILRVNPLTQKEICEETGIPPTALSRWCDYRGRQKKRSKRMLTELPETSMRIGVEVDTPHGMLPLAEFFSAPTRLKGARGRSQEASQEDVEQVLAETKDQGLDTAEIIEMVRVQHGIELEERTVRKYLKKIKSDSQDASP
jgi:hypothetical protein